MCTVSFIYSNQKVIITSNRDEINTRPKSLIPKVYQGKTKSIFFPKDPLAGGTWYAIDYQGNCIVLLNGAKEAHTRKENYARSRGLILLDIFDSQNCTKSWENIDLNNIEPFTILLFYNHDLYQMQWNGTQKLFKKLDEKAKYIWSSSTLYPKEVRDARKQWFNSFINTNPDMTSENVINFHQFTHNEDNENGLVINRNGLFTTQSITQTTIEQNKINFIHKDLIANKEYQHHFKIENEIIYS